VIRWDDPALSGVFAALFLGLLTLVWAALAAGAGKWGRKWLLKPGHRENLPLLSICVPARDEAANIGACVAAALASDWPGELEVVVVDDRSSDGTTEAARAAGDHRLRVVEGTEPPKGWAGKCWACMRAAGEARGELLLFIDADVRLAPWTAAAAATALLKRDLQLLSLFGDWKLESYWEGAVIPVIGWFIRGAVNLDAVNDPSRPEAFANGQFILCRRDGYDQVGGHGVVKAEVLDDVRLARAFKARALPIGLLHGPGSFRVRLYTSLSEIVNGYTKNLYEGMDRRPLLGLGAVMFVFVSTLSPFLLVAGLAIGEGVLGWNIASPGWWLWLLGVCALVFVFRFRLERADGRSGGHALSHPIANVVFVLVLVRSMMGMRASWKGRTFVDGKAH
jgi:chlorobactene glucosyltransferase